MKYFFTAISLALICGCGSPEGTGSSNFAPVGKPNADGVVVKARSMFPVSMGDSSPLSLMNLFISSALAASGNQTVTTTEAASTTFALDNSLFSVPSAPTPFAVNNFGYLQVTDLKDNNMDVCGTGGTTHCGTALIRMYTTGTTAAGLWNTVDQFGAPITAGQTTLAPIGLSVAGAAILQSIVIASNKHVGKLADFANPKYEVNVDFTNAGAGTYATTIVVEYALAP